MTGSIIINDLGDNRIINAIIEKSDNAFYCPITLSMVKYSSGATYIQAQRISDATLSTEYSYSIWLIYCAYYIPTDQ